MALREIPEQLRPDHPDQRPVWATDDDRFALCFAITRAICERDDPVFLRELYQSDMPTDDLADKVPAAS